MEKFNILLRLKVQVAAKSQGVTGYVTLDKDILSKYTFKENQIWEETFSVEVPEGQHSFGFSLIGKTFADTQIDSIGRIIDDTLITLERFEIDDVDLTEMFKLKGRFYKIDGTYEPEVNTNIGFNGYYTFEFETPYYEWLLANV